jgi:hypothetical protein
MAVDQPMGAEAILRRPSKHTTLPFLSRRTKAGMVVMPNWVIKDQPCSPINSRWGRAAHGMGSKKFWVSRMVLHRKTRTAWNGERSLFNKLPAFQF